MASRVEGEKSPSERAALTCIRSFSANQIQKVQSKARDHEGMRRIFQPWLMPSGRIETLVPLRSQAKNFVRQRGNSC